jgi:ribosomal protein L29
MKKQTKDMQEKTIKELEKNVQTIREEIAKLKLEVRIKPQKDTNIIMKKRREIARMLTLINEKRILEVVQK